MCQAAPVDLILDLILDFNNKTNGYTSKQGHAAGQYRDQLSR